MASVQIILNAFRLKPLDGVLPAAAEAGVGVIARVPLAAGLLSGVHGDNDVRRRRPPHLQPGRRGVRRLGETFSGVDYETGVRGGAEFAALIDEAASGLCPAEVALAWVWQQPGVTTVIPGSRNPEQARANAAAGDTDPLPEGFAAAVPRVYRNLLSADIHPRW